MQAVKGAVEKVKEHLPGQHHQEHGTDINHIEAQKRDPLAGVDGVERFDEHLKEGQLPRGANPEEYSERGGAVMPSGAAVDHTQTADHKLRDAPTLAGSENTGGEWPGHQVNALSPAPGLANHSNSSATATNSASAGGVGTGVGAGLGSGVASGAAGTPAAAAAGGAMGTRSEEGEEVEGKEKGPTEEDMRKVWDARNHHPGPKWGTPGTVPDVAPKKLLNHGMEMPNP
eukprot:TRINITY_DN39326_c0_g1_i1.p1 TRINITY_DN39326_c0_g1~~TRINITY_DN39326_c0_g1_i1.p1  ORF type:complete len:229 (+),score=48.14 TRINITY_DN39326_c0_g1_i1:113-799(+)